MNLKFTPNCLSLFCIYLPMLFILTFFQFGCAGVSQLNITLDKNSLTQLEDSLVSIDKTSKNFNGKKICTKFSTNQSGVFYENYNYAQKKPVHLTYKGNIEDDLKYHIDRILENYYNATITDDPNEADIIIKGDIVKYYCQIKEAKKDGDGNLNQFFSKKSIYSVSEFGSLLNIKTNYIINNMENTFTYNKSIRMESENEQTSESKYIKLIKKFKIYNDENNIIISEGAFAQVIDGGFTVSSEIEGYFKVYDWNSGRTINEYSYQGKNLTIEIMRKSKLYDEMGLLKLLAYDYMKELIGQIYYE